jgi:hypothetical protein
MNKQEQAQFLEGRKAAGRRIDAETCEVGRSYGRLGDPYGLGLPVRGFWGDTTYVRSAESDGWVCMDDLPPERVSALRDRFERIKRELRLCGGEDILFSAFY